MRIGRNEIIEELTEHIRKFGGEPGEWRVGTASHDGRFKIQDDRENPAGMTGLAFREAHTPTPPPTQSITWSARSACNSTAMQSTGPNAVRPLPQMPTSRSAVL